MRILSDKTGPTKEIRSPSPPGGSHVAATSPWQGWSSNDKEQGGDSENLSGKNSGNQDNYNTSSS